MSFDEELSKQLRNRYVSIPLEQGNVFRRSVFSIFCISQVSIPLEQGNVFRPRKWQVWAIMKVSIPLEQGNVFRRMLTAEYL